MKPPSEIYTEPFLEHSFSVRRIEKGILASPSLVRLFYHRIVLVEEGEGVLIIDNTPFDIRRNDVFLMSRGQLFSQESSSFITGYIISFGDCFWEKTPQSASNCKAVLFNDAGFHQSLALNESERIELLRLAGLLLDEFNLAGYINQMDVLAAYLKIMMIKLANVRTLGAESFDDQDYIIYRKFIELLSNGFHSFRAVSDYALMMNITSRRLSDICKRCSGSGAKQIIDGQVIAEAKRLLQFSSKSVKEIAYELHFSSSGQFSHFFKTNAQVSPADYRKQFIGLM